MSRGASVDPVPPSANQWQPIVIADKRALRPDEFVAVYSTEPLRYATIEVADVFPTQPYSKIVRGYAMVHPEQVDRLMVENLMAAEVAKEREREEGERKAKEKAEKDKVDRAREREARAAARAAAASARDARDRRQTLTLGSGTVQARDLAKDLAAGGTAAAAAPRRASGIITAEHMAALQQLGAGSADVGGGRRASKIVTTEQLAGLHKGLATNSGRGPGLGGSGRLADTSFRRRSATDA